MASPIPNAKPFTSETAAAAGRKGSAARSDSLFIKRSVVRAFHLYQFRGADKELLAEAKKYAEEGDELGLEVFLLEQLCGNPQAKLAMLAMVTKMLPIEVEGGLDASLTVVVQTLVGNHEIDITRVKEPPKDALRVALPVALPQRAPEVEVDA